MQHSLSLTLKTHKIEGIVTCDDHEECDANKLIKTDAEEFGPYSEYPQFFEWYDGPLTPVRSGAINLEIFDRFVKWSYVEEIGSLATEVPENSSSRLFYAPVFKTDHGIVHNLNSANKARKSDRGDIENLKESLVGFIITYVGAETDYRPGYIKLIETGDRYFGEQELSWTYAD